VGQGNDDVQRKTFKKSRVELECTPKILVSFGILRIQHGDMI
jgi:hypothetical protein